MDTVEIGEPIAEICARLGLEPKNVKEMIFTPRTLKATVYDLNESGSKYVTEEGEAASHEIEVQVSMHRIYGDHDHTSGTETRDAA